MPVPTLVLLGFSTGLAAALAARGDLCLSPRPALFSRACGAYFIFMLLVLLPQTAYFYIFHGDWSLLYLMDTATIPSALVLLGFMLQILIGLAGFLLGAFWVRGHREGLVLAMAGVGALGAIALVLVFWNRLSVVGSYAQFHGQFGLTSYGSGAVFQGTLTMGLVLGLGVAYLLVRLFSAGRQLGL
ncbi:MAG: hypothetical protein IPJ88_09180 [Myxococcales bacterium]|nr:MAG: hypothetical protein IPJ88_09180 [Myxococcales bacterium]